MTILQNLIEPQRLLLTWQPSDEGSSFRTRRVVGCLEQDGSDVIFRYLKEEQDFQKAREVGFNGYPAFRIEDKASDFRQGVLEAFLRRVPPRKREDFDEYLAQHRLPFPFLLSDFALLGYTGAKLPSDGFALVPDFQYTDAPCDFLLEISGVRHCVPDTSSFSVGDPVEFEIDKDNPVDPDAVEILHEGIRIGYVNRAIRDVFRRWLESDKVAAKIERINGKPERPLVYLYVSVK